METKYCTRCEKEKSIEEFAFKNKNTGKRGARCRNCTSEVSAELYKTSDTRKNKIRQRALEFVDYYVRVIRRLKEINGCSKCKQKYPYCVLDFHHVDANKESEISDIMRRGNREKLKKEIKKCIIVCANCHRFIHHEEKYGVLTQR